MQHRPHALFFACVLLTLPIALVAMPFVLLHERWRRRRQSPHQNM